MQLLVWMVICIFDLDIFKYDVASFLRVRACSGDCLHGALKGVVKERRDTERCPEGASVKAAELCGDHNTSEPLPVSSSTIPEDAQGKAEHLYKFTAA